MKPVLAWAIAHPLLAAFVVLFAVGAVSSVIGGGGDEGADASATATPPAASASATTAADTDTGGTCLRVPAARLRALGEGAKSGVQIIPPAYYAPADVDTKAAFGAFAVHVRRGPTERYVVLAAPIKEGEGLTLATESALPFFTWGNMAADGSPAAKVRDAVFSSDGATAALACARGGN